MKKLRLFITTMLVLLFGGLSLTTSAQYSGTLNGDTVSVTGTQASMILDWIINSTTPPATYIEANGDTIILFFGIKNVTLNTILGSQYINHTTVPGDSVNTGITFTITGLTPGYDYEVTPYLILVQSGNQVWFMDGNPIDFTTDCSLSTSISSNPTGSVCAGTDVTLTASGATSYVWNTGETTASIIVTPMSTTTYTVTGTTGGCTAVGSKTVTVLSTFNPTMGPDTAICYGSSTTLNAGGGTTYLWSPSTGLSSTTIANPVCSTTSTRTYTCVISNGTCSTSLTVTVTVGAAISVNITGDANVCAGSPSDLTASSPTATSYLWSTGGTTATITVYPTITTTYTVTVSNGTCTKTDNFTVTAEAVPVVSLAVNGVPLVIYGTGLANVNKMTVYNPNPSIYTPSMHNGDTALKFIGVTLQCDDYVVLETTNGCQGDFTFTCVGVNEEEGEDAIKIYPNPFKDVLYIELPDGKYEINLCNILGQKVQELNAEKSFTVQRNLLPKGMYILKISSKRMTRTFKVQVD